MLKTNIIFLLLIALSLSLNYITSSTNSKQTTKIPDFEEEYSISIERDEDTKSFTLSFDEKAIKKEFEYKFKFLNDLTHQELNLYSNGVLLSQFSNEEKGKVLNHKKGEKSLELKCIKCSDPKIEIELLKESKLKKVDSKDLKNPTLLTEPIYISVPDGLKDVYITFYKKENGKFENKEVKFEYQSKDLEDYPFVNPKTDENSNNIISIQGKKDNIIFLKTSESNVYVSVKVMPKQLAKISEKVVIKENGRHKFELQNAQGYKFLYQVNFCNNPTKKSEENPELKFGFYEETEKVIDFTSGKYKTRDFYTGGPHYTQTLSEGKYSYGMIQPREDTVVFEKYNDNEAVFSFSFLRVDYFELNRIEHIERYYEEPHIFLRIKPAFKLYPSYNFKDFSYLNLMIYRLYIVEMTPGVDYTDYCQLRDQINDKNKVKYFTSFNGNKDNTMFIANFNIHEKFDPEKTVGIVQATIYGTGIDVFYPAFKLSDGSTMAKSDIFNFMLSGENIIQKIIACVLFFIVIYSLIYAKKYRSKISKEKTLLEKNEKDGVELEVVE